MGERTANAQLHMDFGAEAALDKRFLTSRGPGRGDASFGPALRLTGHLALLPLIRVGLYAGYALSPQDDELRHMLSGGTEARIFPPLGIPNFRPFVLVGFGYQRTFAYGTSGGCLETPLGIGASYRVRKPFDVGAILGSRIGFACGGPLYTATSVTGATSSTAAGQDRFGLSLGIMASLEL